MSLSVTPDAGVSLQVIDETLPEGWSATAVSDGGTFDAALRRVRWGLFADDKARVLRYSAMAPEGVTGNVTISGVATFDGQSVNTGGASQSQPNGPPMISALPALSVLEDQTVRITFTVTDDQTPLGDLAVNARGSNDALAPTSGMILRRNGGVYGLDIGLVPETAGRTTITIQANDGTYQSERSFELEVSLTNDTPTITPPAVAAILEDSSVRIGSWEVRDPDAGNGVLEMRVQVFGGSLKLDSLGGAVLASGANESAAMSLRGTLLQLNQALLGSTLTPSPNLNGLVQVQISVNDLGNTGGLDPQTGSSTLSVAVTAVNDAPTFTRGADQSAVQGAGGQTVLGWATNIRSGPQNESGQAVRFIVSTDPESLFLVPPAISPDGTLTYTPAVAAAGSAIVTVQLVDSGGSGQGGSSESAVERFEIVVLDPVNNPPTLSSFSDRTVPEETVFSIPFTVGDDRTDPGGLSVTVSSSNAELVPNSALVLGGSGASRTLLVRLDVESAGQSTITLQVDDGTYRVRRSFALTVQAVNDPPILAAVADQRIDEGETLSVSLSASDSDLPVQALTYARVSGPAGLSVSPSGLVSWTPTEAQGPAIEPVTVSVTDGVATATRSFTVEVREVNQNPILAAVADQRIDEGETLS
ncbi:MAG: Ig-like domain-containing protein, partial [Limisphaerales bacterium]